MGSSKFDARAYPWPTAANERDTRRLFAVFERLNREAQDDIVAAAWAASQRNGINPFDAIAELLVMLSRDRLFVRRQLARYLETHVDPVIIVRAARDERVADLAIPMAVGEDPPPPVPVPRPAIHWELDDERAVAAALAHPEPGSGADFLRRMHPERPPGPCPSSPGNLHQLVVRSAGELIVIECGVCQARSPDSD